MLEFDLPESCTVVNVRRLHALLSELANAQQDVSLNASAVVSVDASALQTLSAFVLAQKESGLNTFIENGSASFVDAARQLGLTGVLGLSR